MHRVHLVIHGRVQGVGFRYFVLRRAQHLELNGWVRNCSSGDVEIEAEGTRAALEHFAAEVGRGPSASVVESVDAAWSEGAARHTRFLIRSDAPA